MLVAGAGITGICAAVSASDDGATQVLCLEKMSEGRGMFEGMGVVGGKKMAEAGNDVDKAEAMDAMRNAAYYRVPVDPIKLWGDRSGEAADWLQDKFDEGDGQIQTYFKQGNPNSHFFPSVQTEIAFRSECTPIADGSTWYKLTELKSCLAADHKTLGQDARIVEQADVEPTPEPSGNPTTDTDVATDTDMTTDTDVATDDAGKTTSAANGQSVSLGRTGSAIAVIAVLAVGLTLAGISLSVWRMRR